MGNPLEKEKTILDFYNEMVRISQKNLKYFEQFFEQAFISMMLGHEFGDSSLCSREMYEMLLMINISALNNTGSNILDKVEYPFTLIDEDKYYERNVLDNMTILKRVLMIIRFYSDLCEDTRETMTRHILEMDNKGFIQVYQEIEKLLNIIRNGWIRRNVPKPYQESDAVHTVQMVGLASAYLTLYKPDDLDPQKVFEMILIHEVGEIMVGDITELDAEHDDKHEKEKRCVEKVFANLKKGMYFINLWEEFEARETNEAKFVYELDKFDPIAKAKYLDGVLGRVDLLPDFYEFEDARKTFENGRLKKVFAY